jgi:hypothetical protein
MTIRDVLETTDHRLLSVRCSVLSTLHAICLVLQAMRHQYKCKLLDYLRIVPFPCHDCQERSWAEIGKGSRIGLRSPGEIYRKRLKAKIGKIAFGLEFR